MRFQPVYPFTAVGDQGNLQFDCIFHFIQHDLFHFFQFVLVDVEVQFIVYLQDHLALQTFGFETVEDANHGNFDDVGCTALDRSVDRVSFGISPYDRVMGVDIRQETFALVDRLYISFFFRHLDAFVHVCTDVRIGFEVSFDQLF